MATKINDISDFINMMRKVSPNIDPNKLDPDTILLCCNMYTEGYNAAMNFVNDCIDRVTGKTNGGEE